MTLTRLVLHNYMIHRDLTADFSGNLIALTGEMGHGKSTFVGAIQFCLTGEHPPWHREDLLSWGASEGSAKLYFSQEGLECSILRKLHNSEVILRIGDETFSGARNVEKEIAGRLGIDKDILRQIGFVQQYEIQSILFDDPGKRERSFQKLLGIGDANKIWTELGPIIQGYSRSENFDASIEALRQSISRLNAELDAAGKMLENANKALSLMPSKDELLREVKRLTDIKSRVSVLLGLRRSIEASRTKTEKGLGRLSDLASSRKAIIDSMGCSLDDMKRFVDGLGDEYLSSKSALDNMRKLTGAVDSDGICPLCGSSVTHGQIQDHTASEMKNLTDRYLKASADYKNAKTSLDLISEKLSRIDSESVSVQKSVEVASEMLAAEKAREKELLSEYSELGISPEEAGSAEFVGNVSKMLEDAMSTVNRYDDIDRSIMRMTGSVSEKRQQLAQAEEMLEKKEKEKELGAPLVHKIDVLTSVRNWFHSSNGPRTMSSSAIRSMTGYVNEYLKELHSEIEVTPDSQGYSFAYTYVDGRTVSDPPPSTAKLSGGQKIELALAFRLAIYRYFGQKMGIMVLDEPTAHLSPAGIEYFGTLLQTVSTLAKNMNMQIVMPTHEKEIMPYMDSEIHFS